MIVQDRLKSGERGRTSFNSSKRRIVMPSLVVIWRASETVAAASSIMLPRWLAARNISVGTPSNGAITATLEKMIRAKGREKRAKRSPVAIAAYIKEMKDSKLTMKLT